MAVALVRLGFMIMAECAMGPAPAEATGPSAHPEYGSHFGGDTAWIPENLGMPVAQGELTADRGPVVSASIAKPALILVADSPVEFHPKVVLIQVNVDPGQLSGHPTPVAYPYRQSMRPLDSTQILHLQRGLHTLTRIRRGAEQGEV